MLNSGSINYRASLRNPRPRAAQPLVIRGRPTEVGKRSNRVALGAAMILLGGTTALLGLGSVSLVLGATTPRLDWLFGSLAFVGFFGAFFIPTGTAMLYCKIADKHTDQSAEHETWGNYGTWRSNGYSSKNPGNTSIDHSEFIDSVIAWEADQPNVYQVRSNWDHKPQTPHRPPIDHSEFIDSVIAWEADRPGVYQVWGNYGYGPRTPHRHPKEYAGRVTAWEKTIHESPRSKRSTTRMPGGSKAQVSKSDAQNRYEGLLRKYSDTDTDLYQDRSDLGFVVRRGETVLMIHRWVQHGLRNDRSQADQLYRVACEALEVLQNRCKELDKETGTGSTLESKEHLSPLARSIQKLRKVAERSRYTGVRKLDLKLNLKYFLTNRPQAS